MKHVIFTEEVDRDLEEASVWFDEHSGIGGTGFVAMIYEVVKNICCRSLRSLELCPGISGLDATASPCHVIYEVTDKLIRIIARALRAPSYTFSRRMQC